MATSPRSSVDDFGRISFENSRSELPNGLHKSVGKLQSNGHDRVQQLEQELAETREEKEKLAAQYRDLLGRLTAMRNTLGNKLKQDAEELDRREQLVQTLTAQNEDLNNTIDALQAELITSNEEAERSSRELEKMRSRAFEETAQESVAREREVQELQADLERCRMERDDWEREALEERVAADEAKASLSSLRRDIEIERDIRAKDISELEREKERSANLQSVLEDFQSVKDLEMRQLTREYETQLRDITFSLAEFKSRALTAEAELQDSTSSTKRVGELEVELKEKNLLIGKIRHETVILNEHLTEALRRLKRNSSDNFVDRRLVTNVLISFLNTPRADSKRFEMLSLLASILSWSDDEREKAGLQRNTGLRGVATNVWRKVSPSAKTIDLEKTDETESFSKMWVEFLLKEASQGSASTPSVQSPTRSLPSSPLYSPASQKFPLAGSPRVLSATNLGESASSIQLSMPPKKDLS